MAREGLMDDCGYKGFDYKPPCENGKDCKHIITRTDEKGHLWAECSLLCCEFEEVEDDQR